VIQVPLNEKRSCAKSKKRAISHLQIVQRCEHPNLSGDGSNQTVLVQIPTAIRSPTRVNCPQKPPPQKKTRGKIHSQPVQRCEPPNLSGNGSTQAVLIQSPTATRSPQSKLPQKPPEKMTRSKIHSQYVQRCEHPNLSGNGSTQAGASQIPTAKEVHRVRLPQKPQKTTRGKMLSQPVQRCEHPNLSGDGSTQSLISQISTAKETQRVNAAEIPLKKQKFTHSLVKVVSIPISGEIVPASP